jgi:DNA-binding XRE family transcriptional regulator
MSYKMNKYSLYEHNIRQIMKSKATNTLPRVARQSLVKLGEDIAIARKKRRISTVSMAERAFVSRGTLYKVEKGDPSVSMGVYATVLAILGLADGLGQIADRRDDTLGLDIEEDRLPKKIVSGSRKRTRT